MKNNQKIKVLGAGSPVVDLLAYVDDSFLEKKISGEKGGMELISSEELNDILKQLKNPFKAPGGSAGNTIFALCRLGAEGCLTGRIGDDENGNFYKSSLENAKGNTQKLKTDNSAPTAKSLCMVTPDAARTMRTHLGAAMNLNTEDIKPEDFKDFPLLHTEGYLIFNRDLITHILRTAKEAGCLISLDLASFEVVNASKDFLPDLLKNYVDIIFANEDEAKAFAETDDIDKALDVLSKFCSICAVKNGAKGSVIKSEKEKIKIEPVFCQNPIDTTGAGDYWAAGFLYGYLKDLPLEICGSLGSVLGAEAVSVLGAELTDDQWKRIFIRTNEILNIT
jgi:sugar/nucleoside kinase (ribokinase family)